MRFDIPSKPSVRTNRWHKWFAWHPITCNGKRVWLETVWASCLDCRGWPVWTYCLDMTDEEARAENEEMDRIGAW